MSQPALDAMIADFRAAEQAALESINECVRVFTRVRVAFRFRKLV